MTGLLDSVDAVLFDLDGTLALADSVIPGASEAVSAVRQANIPALVVTNNAMQTPQQTRERLQRVGLDFADAEIVTSPQAAAAQLARQYPQQSKILITGSPALAVAVTEAGLKPVTSADDDPVAVIQGLDKTLGWPQLAEATLAIRRGASWIATNADATLPTDRGALPGSGAMIAAVATATGQQPTVTGKPERALVDIAVERCGAQQPLMIGDRLETDIAAGIAAQVPTLMVLTGVSNIADMLATSRDLRPTYLAADLRGLLADGAYLRLADYPDDEALKSAASQLVHQAQNAERHEV